MTAYPSYKNSGIEWIGDLPEHWETMKLKYLALGKDTYFNDGDWIESKHISQSGVRYLTTGNVGEGVYKEQGAGYVSDETFEELNCTSVYEGDLILSRLNEPIGRSCIVPNLGEKVVVAVDIAILRPNKNHHKKYLLYLFSTKGYFEFNSLIASGATMQRISRGLLGNVDLSIPPLKEQTQIAEFLEQKTTEIDTAIQHLQKLIDLLKEERNSLINEAVTKGINPKASLKASGIEWIGDIPAHWEIMKLKYISKTNPSNVDKKSKEDEQSVLLCNYTDVYKNDFITSKIEFMKATASDAQIEKFTLEIGDVILTKDSEDPTDIAEPALVKEVVEDLVCGYHLTLIKPFKDILLGEYLFRLFESDYNIYFQLEANGITRYGIGSESFKNAFMLVPPLEEQIEIVAHIEAETNRIDTEIEFSKDEITLLKEYKQALITEAVTGKIDVRNYKL